nr:putative ribonuclease H-like domain-containing protein [Tanacetum cinerariifolium]
KIENLNEVRVKELRSENGTEFKNHKLEEFCDEKCISLNFSSLCTPEQNGVAERRKRTLIEAARTMGHLGKFDEKAEDGFFLEPPVFTTDDGPLAVHKPDYAKSAEILDFPSNPVPQVKWPRDKHIKLVNIIDEPLAGITTRSMIRDSDAASAHECLYVNFLSKIEPKKLIEALDEEGWVIAMQEELNQFERNK